MADSGVGKRMLQARLDLAARRGREVPKAEIAQAVGLLTPTYGRYENGEREPGIELLPALAQALETDIAYLVSGAKPAGGKVAGPMVAAAPGRKRKA